MAGSCCCRRVSLSNSLSVMVVAKPCRAAHAAIVRVFFPIIAASVRIEVLSVEGVTMSSS